MSKKNFMSYGDAETILTEYAQGVKDVKNPQFTEASTRNNIASGESYTTIFGKIKKFFSDLKAVAFSGSYNDLSDKPTIPSALADLTTDNTKGAVRYGKTWGSTLAYSFDTDGLIIDQRQAESSGVQFNGDYISFWSPADGGYSMRYFDEDNGNEIWNIDSAGKFSGTIDWARVNGSNQALKMKGWWSSGSSNNADNLNNGAVFAYAASHNTPTTGPLFAFASEDGNKYVAQVQFQYNGDAVYHRVKNGDNNTWRNWQAFKSQADVNSAYSLGYQQRVEILYSNSSEDIKQYISIRVSKGLTAYSYIFVYGRLSKDVSGYYGVLGGINPSKITKVTRTVKFSDTVTSTYNDVIAELICMGTVTFVRLLRSSSNTEISITQVFDRNNSYRQVPNTQGGDKLILPCYVIGVLK